MNSDETVEKGKVIFFDGDYSELSDEDLDMFTQITDSTAFHHLHRGCLAEIEKRRGTYETNSNKPD